jgi:hypothetical protein
MKKRSKCRVAHDVAKMAVHHLGAVVDHVVIDLEFAETGRRGPDGCARPWTSRSNCAKNWLSVLAIVDPFTR